MVFLYDRLSCQSVLGESISGGFQGQIPGPKMRVIGRDVAMKDAVLKSKADARKSVSDHCSKSLLSGDIGRRLLSHREEVSGVYFKAVLLQ